MITRIWHGWTKPENADAYEDLLKSEIFGEIEGRSIDGFLGIDLLRREVGPEVEFVTVMRFESLDAVRDFAGDEYEVAVVPAKARSLLSRFDARSQHYETKVVDGQNMNNEIQYNPGYERNRWVGFFDLLGIKRILKDKGTTSVFFAYSEAIEQLKRRMVSFDDVKYTWFSDSFVIYTADDSGQSFRAIDQISRWFFYFLITGGIPARGSISCGIFYADSQNDLFFGTALIEAYEYGEAQNWIGFILCPSAKQRLIELKLQPELRLNYANTSIPYNKRNNKLDANLPACILGSYGLFNNRNPCLNSLISLRDRVDDERIIEKYDNTIAFIEANKRR